jgi:amino acid transporter
LTTDLESASDDKTATLKRDLGPRIAMAVVVGNVIGSGIFLKPATIAGDGGSFGLIISVWVLGGVLCILGALCFAELATMFPEAGGLYVYLREAYGRPIAFLFGWADFTVRVPGAIAALSVVFVGQLMYAVGWQASPLVQVVVVTVVIAGLAWVNIIGVLWGGGTQMATTIVKATTLAFVALAPLLLIAFAEYGVDVANYSTRVEPAKTTFAARVGAVLLAVMWAYNGWHGVTPLAEEIRDPQRNLPKALFGGIGILILLYLSANFAYHGVLSMDEVRQVAERNAEAGSRLVKETAGSAMFEKMLGRRAAAAFAWIICFSTFGAICTNMLQAPRITFAMGRDGVFFRSLGRVHATYRTPAAAIFVAALMAISLVVVVAVAKTLVGDVDPAAYGWELTRRVMSSLKDGSVFDLLTDFVIFSASIFYLLAVLAVVILRIRRPDLPRAYRTWGYPVVPLLFIGVYVWFLSQIYLDKPLEAHTGLVIIAAGLPVYYGYRRWRQSAED